MFTHATLKYSNYKDIKIIRGNTGVRKKQIYNLDQLPQ